VITCVNCNQPIVLLSNGEWMHAPPFSMPCGIIPEPAPQPPQQANLSELMDQLRHKEAELAYLKKQKAMVKFEVKMLRRLVERAKQ